MGDRDQRHEKRLPFGRPHRPDSARRQTPRRPEGQDGPADDTSDNRSVNGASNAVPPAVPPRVLPFPVRRSPRPRAPEPSSDEDLADELDEPIDLVAVQADDELINALAEGMTVSTPGHLGYDVDDKIVAMLAAWKAEVEAEPVPELVDIDQAIAAIDEGKPSAAPPSRFAAWRRVASGHRLIVPAAVAAAVLVFSFGGVSIGAADAQPGDALFGVTKVLYSERAESREAAVTAKQYIAQVSAKLAAGDTAGAQREIAALEPLLEKVAPAEGRTYLAAEQSFLAAKISETPPNTPTDPNAPLSDGTPRPADPRTQNPVVPPSGSSRPGSSTQPSSGASTRPSQADPRALNSRGGSSSPVPGSPSAPVGSSVPQPPATGGQTGPSTRTTAAPTSSASPSSGAASAGSSATGTSSAGRSSFTTASGSSSAATSGTFTTASGTATSTTR